MKCTVKKLPKSEMELTITVSYGTYQKHEKKALEELNKSVKVDGFRSGHIPEEVVRERVNPEAIISAALDHVLPETYMTVIKENDIHVIAPPKVEIKTTVKKEGDDLVYTAVVAVMPEVKVGNYKKIKITRPKVEVKPKQVDETIEMIMSRFAEWKDVSSKAKKDHRAEVDFEGFDEKGEAIPNTASKNHPIILGSETMVPGFEDAIIGMSVGETKEFKVTFPKDYHAESMRGQKVKFKLTLSRLEEKLEQTLDEAMIEKIVGEKQGIEDFKKKIGDDLKTEMETRSRQEHDNSVVDAIIKMVEVDLPQVLMDEEVKFMLDEKREQVSRQGLKWEQYLQHVKKTEEDFAKEHQKPAEERVKARLGIQYIIKDANITVAEEEVDKRVAEIIGRYPEEQKKHVIDHYKKGSQGRQNIHNSLMIEKLIEMLSA
ncbi:trigger factor [Candidatus Peregrinibacteria bacterium CG_4_10_14_0_2_um_filter_43_11]|nr:MAG: trigger factor [Candidatus Peregrinibacteria bacterium CG_4_10_14_0_2_um_filter_43_11]